MVPETTADTNGDSDQADARDSENTPIIDESQRGSVGQPQSVDMHFEQNDGVVCDVEAVSQESSGSGATLAETLRSLDVEIGSADGQYFSATINRRLKNEFSVCNIIFFIPYSQKTNFRREYQPPRSSIDHESIEDIV
ncbi:hypothetical protein Tco_0115118 [Tanacetum coccineum]